MIVKADTTCRYLHREVERLGHGALAGFNGANTLSLTTERLVKPSIPLLQQVARRQQALQPQAHDEWFDLYAELFDPIIAISQERLRAGQAEDFTRARDLEDSLTELGLEQKLTAQHAGLKDCDVDFGHVLLDSLSE